ncbi:TlpA family protein disulfide reductase [Flavilitoribacter nigricans]|uniref:Thioredoxin domain-containing protein n=1 Tax=Flavilitoribacter nigricans (strain ATCC 23147 / DSM 23189 / NBRC 102662 / NCIMB 1420 / SS-2) TaxID=1122177 RepID=A0A2D0NHP5_FLAN2|nr:TlpA disulfide reductase family protein [Flavilitoribacter nigricans]PHN07900.1 hypothetical protein CRP01_03870 [Flavilitoribacter nigricans DSM 23189 = NBRC 102662]
MKTTFLMLCAALLFSNLNAQQPESHHNAITAKITGQLNGYDPEKDQDLELKFVSVVPTPEHQAEKMVRPNADGSFAFQPDYPLRYQQIWFGVGENYFGQLIIDRDLSIDVDLDALRDTSQHFASEFVRFGGSDGELNQLVNDFTTFEISQRPAGGRPANIEALMDRELSPAGKTEKLLDYYDGQEVIVREFLQENPSPYGWLLTNQLASQKYGEIAVAHWGHTMPEELMEEMIRHRPFAISNESVIDYYGYLSNYMLMNSQQELLDIYREDVLPAIPIAQEQERLQEFISLFSAKLDEQEYDKEVFRTESKYFREQYEKEVYAARVKKFTRLVNRFPSEQADLLKLVGGGKDIWERELYIGKLMPTIKTTWAAELMEKEWETTRQQIEMVNKKLNAIKINKSDSPMGENVGQLPNGADLILAKQEELEELLGSIRAAYPDQAIILDVWATWCGPCIYDMQNSAENREKLEELGVQVIYLCSASGSSEEKWKKKVAELGVAAPQIFLSPELSKSIMSYFELPGYPSHVFIDKDGQYHPDLVHSLRTVDLEAVKEKL